MPRPAEEPTDLFTSGDLSDLLASDANGLEGVKARVERASRMCPVDYGVSDRSGTTLGLTLEQAIAAAGPGALLVGVEEDGTEWAIDDDGSALYPFET